MFQTRRIGAVVLAVFAVIIFTAGSAQASDENFLSSQDKHYLTECGRFWPSTGSFQTSQESGNYSATLVFKLTKSQKKALECVSPYLELDFRIFGFDAPAEWDNYSASGTIPGAIHDTAKDDKSKEATPGITGIKVADLVPDREYRTTISFSLPRTKNDAKGPRVSIEWVPSYVASSIPERAVCSTAIFSKVDAMCIFGKTRAFLSHGYTNNTSLTFDGYRIWEFKS